MLPGSTSRWSDVLLTAGFCGVLFLPLFASFVDLDPAAEMGTLRFPEDPPRIEASWASWRSFPHRFESFFQERFGFRRSLVRADRLLKYRIFRVSANPSVVLGKADWFYLRAALDNHRAQPLLSTAKLDEWRILFEERRAWLEERGIRYLVVFAPDKSSIYPEHIPDAYRAHSRISRLDQLLQHLEDHSQVSVLDLRSALLPSRDSLTLYPRTDSHWTDLGASLAAERIADALGRWFPEVADVDPAIRDGTRWTWGGDLTELLGVEASIPEQMPIRDLVPAQAVRVADLAHRYPWYLICPVYETGDPRLPRGVIFRDSFAIRLVPFLAERFRRLVSPWCVRPTLFDPSLIEEEKPDVVIDQFVERQLGPADHPSPNHPWVTAYDERFPAGAPRASLERSSPELLAGTLLEAVPGSYRFRTAGHGASLALEEAPFRPGELLLARLEIEAPEAVSARLYVRPAAGEHDPDDLAVTRFLEPGANVIHIPLASTTGTGRVILDVGPATGVFTLRDLEVRSVYWSSDSRLFQRRRILVHPGGGPPIPDPSHAGTSTSAPVG